MLDIRQTSEFTAGHIPGADHVELGELADEPASKGQQGPTVVMCGHGERAMGAASLLARAGQTGCPSWLAGLTTGPAATGCPLEAGS